MANEKKGRFSVAPPQMTPEAFLAGASPQFPVSNVTALPTVTPDKPATTPPSPAESKRERGRPKGERDLVSTKYIVGADQKEALREIGHKEHKNASVLLREAIDNWLEKNHPEYLAG